MGVLLAGVRVRLDRPNTPKVSDVWTHRSQPGTAVRGFLVINESSATILVKWQGGQPGGSTDYQHIIGSFEAAALPVASQSDRGSNEIWFFSTDPTAQFIYSLYDEPVPVFIKANPATVPTAAAVKLEDRAVGGRWALIGADGSLLVTGTVNVSGTIPTSNAAGSQVDGHSATIGTTADGVGATTVIGRLQNLLSRIPAALTGAGNLKVSISESIALVLGAGSALIGIVTTRAEVSAFADRSGTITAGGTSQTVMAGNVNRRAFFVQNVSDTAMWINFNAAATPTQPSIYLAPTGGYFESKDSFVTNEQVNIYCATTGKAYTAKES